VGFVGGPHDVVDPVVGDHRQRGTELLVVDDRLPAGGAGDDRRLEEVAWTVHTMPSGRRLGAVLQRIVDQPLDVRGQPRGVERS
jgi:hypothetical protein